VVGEAVSPAELAALRIELSALPGFDPVGLDVERSCCGHVIGDPYAGPPECCGDPDEWVSFIDASTRDRVARWLAGRVGLTVGSTAPGWWHQEAVWVLAVRRAGGVKGGSSARTFSGSPRWAASADGGKRRHVPTLGDLDPSDPRLLPDGSRYVNALALARVAVTVGKGGRDRD
jgi:hypothetical protein